MTENFFQKAKADGQVFVKTVSLGTRLGKLQLEIGKKNREKERMLKVIGAKVVELYEASGKIDAEAIFAAVSGDLHATEQLEKDVEDLTREIEQVKSDFRTQQGGGNAQSPPPPPPENHS